MLDAVHDAMKRLLQREEARLRGWPGCSRCGKHKPRLTMADDPKGIAGRQIVSQYWSIVWGDSITAGICVAPGYGAPLPEIVQVLCSDCTGIHPDPTWWRI